MCPRDPNYKTNEAIEAGTIRLSKLKDFRKFFSDTAITTTHFLKKCIKVPKITIKDAVNDDGVTPARAEEIQLRQEVEPFKRGSMNFDDYNYKQYNKFLLIDPDRDENDKDALDLGDFGPQPPD